MVMDSWLSLCPSIIAIVIAVATRQVYVALFSGILAGSVLLKQELFFGVTASFDAVAKTFESGSSVKSMLFIFMVGALLNVMQQSGGVQAVIEHLTRKRTLVKSKRGAQLVAYLMGFFMCLEGVGSMMMVGLVGRPLFIQFGISKEKLAYIANSTGSPLAWLMPISGAGVFLASLVSAQVESGVLTGAPMSYVFAALPYQFYTIIVLLSVPVLAFRKHDFRLHSVAPPKLGESGLSGIESSSPSPVALWAVVSPIALLMGAILFITLITGNGNPLKGDISSAIYWSGYIALIGSAMVFCLKGISTNQYIEWCLDGFKNMLPAVIILTLAFTLSGVVADLGAGDYLAGFVSTNLPSWLLPAVVCLLGMLVSFSTGSSGATVSILTPIVIPLAIGTSVSVPVVIGAVISGAVFGDQSSPISDSVIVASSAADCEPEQHFITQLPLTLLFASVAVVGYLTLGVFM